MSNDWTNKLRNQLADYQEPVSHDMWAEIEQSLAQSKKVGDEETDVKKRPQTRYVVLKRWSVAAAIALLGVGGSYVYLHDDEPGQANLAVQSSFSTASGSSRTSSAVRAEAQSSGSENAILLAENNASVHQVNRHSSGRQLNHSKSSVSFRESTVAADNEVMLAAEVEMPEQSVNAEVNGRELSVLQKQMRIQKDRWPFLLIMQPSRWKQMVGRNFMLAVRRMVILNAVIRTSMNRTGP